MLFPLVFFLVEENIAGWLEKKRSKKMNKLEKNLKKIKDEKEKEEFKYNYLVDAIISSEVRIPTWIYRELFNKDYKIKKR